MNYRLEIKATAEKQMKRLPRNVFEVVARRILALRAQPRPPGVKKLVGGLGWRLRVGDYRVIYAIDDEHAVVTVIAVKPRQSAYS